MSIDEIGFLSPDIAQHRELFRRQYAEYFALVEKAVRCCHSAKYRLNVHNRDGQEVFAAGLLLKLMADVEAATLFLERGIASPARSLLRVALECSINLANICQSYEFIQTFVLIAERERLRLIKGIKQSNSSDFAEFKKTLADGLVKEIEERLDGQPDTKIRELAKNVGMEDSVEPMFEYDKNDEIRSFNWGPAVEQDLRPELIESARLLITALSLIQKVFDLDIEKEVSELSVESQRLANVIVNEKDTPRSS